VLIPHGNSPSEISKCPNFFKALNLIDHVLFYPMHVKQVSDDPLVTATTAAMTTMATWIIGVIDAMLPGACKIQKCSCEVPCRINGKQGFWHHGEQPKVFPSDHGPITCDMQASVLKLQQAPLQATYHEHQVPLQGIHHVHFNLEDLAFLDFEEPIVLGNFSVLLMKPCLPVATRSLLAYHDAQFSKTSEEIYAQSFPEKVVGNNGMQVSCALTVAAGTKPSAFRKSISMDIKTFVSVSLVHSFGKHMSIDCTDGEQFSAVGGYHEQFLLSMVGTSLLRTLSLPAFRLILVVFCQEDLFSILEVSQDSSSPCHSHVLS